MNEYWGAFWNVGHCEDGGPCENDGGLDWKAGPGGGGAPRICDGGGAKRDDGCARGEEGGG